ncbi:MAG: hypothetical protein ABSB84_03865 [Verrucomicrobiota bacterium]|jgi:hypothetical protein
MWWKIIVEVVLVVGLLAAGGSFWVCAKSRRHFIRFIRDQNALKQLYDFIGRDKFIAEATTIEPVFGSFADNMVALGRVHFAALDQTRNLTFIATAILLAGSYLLGIYFLIANVILFALLGVGDISGWAKNSSATHAHELIGNIYKWYQTDPEACCDYCCRKSPMLTDLYHLVALNLPPGRSAVSSHETKAEA